MPPDPASDSLSGFFANFPRRRLCKNQIVIHSGDSNSFLHYLSSGYLRSNICTEAGWSFTVNILAPGSVFPLTQVLSSMDTNPHNFQAMTAIEIRSAPTAKVLRYLDDNPELYSLFARKFASGIEGLVSRLEHLVRADGQKRVLCAFDLLLKKFGIVNSDGSISITFPHTHQDIAEIAGVTRETVTRVLNSLKKMGILNNHRRQTRVSSAAEINRILMTDDSPQKKFGL